MDRWSWFRELNRSSKASSSISHWTCTRNRNILARPKGCTRLPNWSKKVIVVTRTCFFIKVYRVEAVPRLKFIQAMSSSISYKYNTSTQLNFQEVNTHDDYILIECGLYIVLHDFTKIDIKWKHTVKNKWLRR